MLLGIYRFFFELFLSLATLIIPKRENLVLFAPFYYNISNGSLWPLYLYINNHCPNLKPIFITDNRNFFYHLKELNIPAVFGGSFKYFRLVARARFLIVDHNTLAVFWWGGFQALSNLKVIQLWHGSGFKKVTLADEKKNPKKMLYKLRNLDLIIRCRNYDYIIASSEEDRKRKMESFNNNNVFITGEPKNDLFYKETCLPGNGLPFKLAQYKRIFLYAPTFRDAGINQPFSDDFWTKLNEFMKKSSSVFLIKRHPQDQTMMVPASYNRIKDISFEEFNLQAVLKKIDLLITDYSSIAVDFVLTGKPILYYLYDYSRYVQDCRSLYYNLKEILPGPLVYSQERLLFYLENENWFLEQSYRDRYDRFKNRFHYYQDGKASERIAEQFLGCSKGDSCD